MNAPPGAGPPAWSGPDAASGLMDAWLADRLAPGSATGAHAGSHQGLSEQGSSRLNQQGVYDQHGRQQQPVGSQLGYGGQPDAAALAAALSTQLQVDSPDQRDPQAYLPQQPHSQAGYGQHQQQASQQPLHDQGLPDLVGPHPLEAARRHSSGNLRGSAPDLQGLTGRLTASSSTSSLTNLRQAAMVEQQRRQHQQEHDVFSPAGDLELGAEQQQQQQQQAALRHQQQASLQHQQLLARLQQGQQSHHTSPPGQQQHTQESRNWRAGSAASLSSGTLSHAGDSMGNGLNLMGEVPLDEQPSRILYVSGIAAEVSDEELCRMFEEYGEIRSLYTACKPQGYVVLTFYDLRAAFLAVHALRGSRLREHPLTVRFSTSKDNMADKAVHQGSVTIYNVDPGVTPLELDQQFSVHGEVRDVRASPQIQGCWVIEYYDIRHAAAALQALNRTASHASLPVVNESSSSQQMRSMQGLRDVQSSHVLSSHDAPGGRAPSDESWQGPRSWENSSGAALRDQIAAMLRRSGSGGSAQQPVYETPGSEHLSASDLQALLHQQQHQQMMGSNPDLLQPGALEMLLQSAQLQPGSDSLARNSSTSSLPGQVQGPGMRPVGSSLSLRSATSPRMGTQGSCTLQDGAFFGQQQQHQPQGYGPGPPGRRNLGSMSMSTGDLTALYEAQAQQARLNAQAAGLAAAASNNSLPGLGLNSMSTGDLRAPNSLSANDLRALGSHPSLWQAGQNMGGSAGSPTNSGYWGSSGNLIQQNLDAQALLAQQQQALNMLQGSSGLDRQGLQGAFMPASPTARGGNMRAQQQQLLQQQRQQQELLASLDSRQQAALLAKLQLQGATGLLLPVNKLLGRSGKRDDLPPGGRLSRRAADPVAEAERKAQQEKLYFLDIERILGGDDRRTTLMIKNIPNKYTQRMLLNTIDENFKGTYDFFYLPIDFKNKCNVGYAFINMVQPGYIVPFVQKFDHKKWDKFNSEKVCQISYARIQGKQSLVTHFQNSSLLHEDKRCRPILFNSNGEVAGEQEPFPVGPNLRGRAKAPTNKLGSFGSQ